MDPCSRTSGPWKRSASERTQSHDTNTTRFHIRDGQGQISGGLELGVAVGGQAPALIPEGCGVSFGGYKSSKLGVMLHISVNTLNIIGSHGQVGELCGL